MPFCRAHGMQRYSSSGTEGNVNLQGLRSQSPCPSHLPATVASPQWKILGEDAQRKVHGKAFQTPSTWNLKGGNRENASLTCLTGMFCHTEHPLFLKMTKNSFGDPRCRAELTQEFGYFPVYLFYLGLNCLCWGPSSPIQFCPQTSCANCSWEFAKCLWKENLDPHGQRRGLFAAIPPCLQGVQAQQAQTCLSFTKHQ